MRLIQDARKSAGLVVSDRIVVRWSAQDPELAAAVETHGALIAGEVLAVSFGPGTAPGASCGDGAGGPWQEFADEGLGLRFWLAVAA